MSSQVTHEDEPNQNELSQLNSENSNKGEIQIATNLVNVNEVELGIESDSNENPTKEMQSDR